jgi:hypothetical protein
MKFISDIIINAKKQAIKSAYFPKQIREKFTITVDNEGSILIKRKKKKN